jgi:DMSO reductase anchor subunit
MPSLRTSTPIELIPGEPQTVWHAPAVLNFALGGLGAGGYVSAALLSGLEPSPALATAAWLGPALVFAGFGAVAAEAGRPLRGPRALARLATSWMSRELWLGGVFAALAAAEFVAPSRGQRLLAVIAALGLAAAHGLILRRARAIAAWDVGIMPLVFVASALVSGTGLYAVIEGVAGRPPSPALSATIPAVVIAGLGVWDWFLGWTRREAFVQAIRPLRRGRARVGIVGVGFGAPLVLAGVAVAWPAWALPATALAGALMIAGQLHAKSALIGDAGRLRPITLPGLRLPGRTP